MTAKATTLFVPLGLSPQMYECGEGRVFDLVDVTPISLEPASEEECCIDFVANCVRVTATTALDYDPFECSEG
jgi:hypothetical protein